MVAEKDRKGTVAELEVEAELTRRGFVVSYPTMDARYDMIVDTGDELHRVQVKRAFSTEKDGSIKVQADLRSEVVRGGETHKDGYTADEIDAFAVYDSFSDSIYWLWADEAPQQPCRTPETWKQDHIHVAL